MLDAFACVLVLAECCAVDSHGVREVLSVHAYMIACFADAVAHVEGVGCTSLLDLDCGAHVSMLRQIRE